MATKYQLWYHDPQKVIHSILKNPELINSIDYIPYCNFMSGDWAWDQCVSELYKECWRLLILPQKDLISVDIDIHRAIFIPIILGSDKTTISVATGQHEYHPVYLLIRNVHNHIRQSHKDAFILIGFLPIPKGEFMNAPQDLHSHKYLGVQKDTNKETF